MNKLLIANNRIERNAGKEPDSSHGGAVYAFGNTLSIVGNAFIDNSVTQWGGGLYVGAYNPGNQPTKATMTWNVYTGNRAGNSGGGCLRARRNRRSGSTVSSRQRRIEACSSAMSCSSKPRVRKISA